MTCPITTDDATIRWALISGEKGREKSDVALAAVERLKAAGLKVAGFVQIKHKTDEGKHYELVRLGKPERIRLAMDGVAPKGPSQEAFCSMAFENEAFERARAWLHEDAPSADVVVLAEVSKLEVMEKGHAPTVRDALRLGKPLLISARASALFYVMENFKLDAPFAALELPSTESDKQSFLEQLVQGLRVDAAA